MSRTMVIQQPFDLALTLEMGPSFRWTRFQDTEGGQPDPGNAPEPQQGKGSGWHSGVLWHYLVHLRRSEDGLEYCVGGEEGERHDVDLERVLYDYFRLDDDIEAIDGQLKQEHEVGSIRRESRPPCRGERATRTGGHLPGQAGRRRLALQETPGPRESNHAGVAGSRHSK